MNIEQIGFYAIRLEEIFKHHFVCRFCMPNYTDFWSALFFFAWFNIKWLIEIYR